MDFRTYQDAAKDTSELPLDSSVHPAAPVAPILGLASEVGQIANVWKKWIRDNIDPIHQKAFLKEELGDVLWFLSILATTLNLDLGEIAQENLRRTQDRYPKKEMPADYLETLPALEAVDTPLQERLPRRLVIRFNQEEREGALLASLTLVKAEPNHFPDGQIQREGKPQGFVVGHQLGARLTDNSRRQDAYRFHDAIHLGFMAVLGWSPTTRDLLRVKRKSNHQADEVDDGARAVFTEEGMSAILARLAEGRRGFLTEESVDGDALTLVRTAISGLEVARLPTWLWRRAISQGFLAMKELERHSGGYLIADLDRRSLTFQQTLEH